MPLHVGDYLADTGHLSTAQHGAYFLLIMHYWRTGSLPSDDRQLANVTRLPFKSWTDAKPIIQAFFHNGWKHKRIDGDLAATTAKYERRAAAGHKGGVAKAKQKSSNATDLPDQCSSNLEPRTENLEIEDTGLRPRVVAKATHPREPDRFEEFWSAYPRREGANPKAPAAKKFAALVRQGVPQQALIDAAKRCAAEYTKGGSAGTQFVPQAITWLNQQRFGDYGGEPIKEFKPFPVTPGTAEWRAWEAYHGGRLNPQGQSFGLQQMKAAADDRKPYQAVTQWPPGHEPIEPPEPA